MIMDIGIGYCQHCGCELTEDNCREMPESESLTGYSHLCISCEEEYYSRLAAVEGNSLALFHCCAAFNVPCKPIVFDGVEVPEDEGVWMFYLNRLEETDEWRKNGKLLTFFDGETDILRVFGKYFTEKDFAKYIQFERGKLEKQVGTKAQRERWGTIRIYKDMPMTQEVYDELDRQYETRAADFKGQTLSATQENTLMQVAKFSVISDHLCRNGLIKSATDVQKSIDMLLASEEMRKKDSKPTENFRIDAQIDALNRLGLCDDGKFLNFEQTVQTIFDKCVAVKDRYSYTLDVADQMIFDFKNNYCANQDLPLETELSEDLQVTDTYKEFAGEESEEEKTRKAYAKTVKLRHSGRPPKKEEETGANKKKKEE